MSQKGHWEAVYSATPRERLGWYAPHLRTTLTWIRELGLAPEARIIDVGAGTSTLVDDLLHAGYRSITVMDISGVALSLVSARLVEKAKLVTWLEGDVTTIDLPPRHYELWHDRAVFHFLTDVEQKQKYRDNLLKALRPGGDLIIGTFTLEAPPTCSGLPVERYDPERLQNTLGYEFELKRYHRELHVTPRGVEQMYLFCHFRKHSETRVR